MDVDSWLELLEKGKVMTERDVKLLCVKVSEILCEVPFLSRNRTCSL